MIKYLIYFYRKEFFLPSPFFGLLINPFYIIRKGILKGIYDISGEFKGGKLLDFGCGSKPYEKLFSVDQYIGVDIKISGHNHKTSKIDIFFDGKDLPFRDNEFDWVFTSEVFEHVFSIDDIIIELKRVLKSGGKLGFTCPFVWDEHEQPYDFGRYTSFGIKFLMEKHGFEIIYFKKSSTYVLTIFQMISAYIWQHILPNNKTFKLILTPFIITPINLTGIILNFLVPENYNFFHNNIVIVMKK